MKSNLIFHHLGIATKSIENCIKIYRELGYNETEITIEYSQNVKICFLNKRGSPLLELIEPLNDDSPVSRIVKNSGTAPYHTCYEVENIENTIDELEGLNFRLLFEPINSDAMEDGLFCYLFSLEIGLIELYQKAKNI